MKSHLGNGESELDTFSKIAKGHLNFPETLAEAFDLLYKVSLAYLVFSLTIVLGGNIRIFHMLALILVVRDLEAKVPILSNVIRGLMVLTGKGLQIVAFLFLMRSPTK